MAMNIRSKFITISNPKMKKLLFVITALLVHLSVAAQQANSHIAVDFARKGAVIAPAMYGVFFEEIGHAGEGGLYGELLRNRSFEDNTLVPGTTYQDGYMVSPHLPNYDTARTARRGGYSDFPIKFDTTVLQGWALKFSGGAGAMVTQTTLDPFSQTAPHNLQFKIEKANSRDLVSLINSGFSGQHYGTKGRPYGYNVYNPPIATEPYGIALNKDEQYNLRLIIRTGSDYKGRIIARLLDAGGNTIGEQSFQVKKKGSWQEYEAKIQPSQTLSNGKFSLSFDAPGTVWVDYVSLLPVSTFNNRPNGLRKDVATMLADLKPGFIRWPGGCIVEGMTLANRYQWKETLGDPAGRPGEFDLWGYRNSYGFGYHEFLQYCEDIHAAGMFVCNAGMSCLYRNGDYCSKGEVKDYIQDALDAIEYAIGDPKTKWGAKRAAAGHPAPFPLRFIEVGNENQYAIYAERYDQFYKAIKAKYPQMEVIANYGMADAEKNAQPGRPVDMIDPHWYESPDFFYSHHELFDFVQPRPHYKMYVGEYSANQNVGRGNLEGALSEAVFAMGMERNSDLVQMCSYAPLLQHVDDNTWPVNMIIFKTDSVYGRTSYYVQQMLSRNKPDINLKTLLNEDLTAPSASGILRHYAIAGYDEKTDEIIIKVVNGEATPYRTKIDLKNAGQLAQEGTAVILSSASEKEENSFSAPLKVVPQKTKVSGVSSSFDYEFKPFSFTVLRIKRV
jgi:alpha-L-arabinofuranosidase